MLEDEEQSHPCPQCGCEMGATEGGFDTMGLCSICFMAQEKEEEAWNTTFGTDSDADDERY